MSEKYNGWTNYETWVVNLWMSNDEGSYHYWTDIVRDFYDEADSDDTFTKKESAIYNLTNQLKDQHIDNQPDTYGVYADLITAALDTVDWREIAEHWIDDHIENLDEND